MRRYVAIVHHSLDIVMVFKTPRPIYYFDIRSLKWSDQNPPGPLEDILR